MLSRLLPSTVFVLWCIGAVACSGSPVTGGAATTVDDGRAPAPVPSSDANDRRPSDPLDAWMYAPFPVADGFDYALGDANGKGSYVDSASGERHSGYYVATEYGEVYSLGIHPGEDWNGRGGGNTDLGLPVHAIASGRVAYAAQAGQPWGNVVVVDHVYYENHERRELRSLYAHLDAVAVTKGEVVARRQVLGTVGRDPRETFPAHLHLELRVDRSLSPTFWPSSEGWDQARVDSAYLDPSDFIDAHRSLFDPHREEPFLLIDHDSRRMRLYRKGKLISEHRVGFGQADGAKRERGDLKTPKGMYFVVSKARGEIGGPYGEFYGGHWIKVNYPNAYDAVRGVTSGWISKGAASRIDKQWRARTLTDQGTRLGGGIGLHGWISDWPDDGPRGMSWGCVVLHNGDIAVLYDQLPEGTMVVLR